MRNGFDLVAKYDRNVMGIFCVLPNGEYRQILHCIFPNDCQMGDNVRVAEEIIPILRKRIRRSLGRLNI